jgi:hypothetical protein
MLGWDCYIQALEKHRPTTHIIIETRSSILSVQILLNSLNLHTKVISSKLKESK